MHELLLNGFALGDLRVRPLLGEIEAPTGVRHVQPKTMEVLLRLAREPGEVVSRETLLHDVWRPGYPSMQPLTRCVSDLRQALADDAHEPRFVQTLPKRGYRLLIAPRPLDVSGETEPSSDPGLPLAESGSGTARATRGHVLRVAAVYGALAWLLVQVAETVFPALGLPDWTLTFVLALLVLGFPLALVLGWATSSPGEPGVRNRGVAVSLGLAGLLISGVAGWWFHERSGLSPEVARPVSSPPSAELAAEPTLAVLPFAGLQDADGEPGLAEGLSEELTTRRCTTMRSAWPRGARPATTRPRAETSLPSPAVLAWVPFWKARLRVRAKKSRWRSASPTAVKACRSGRKRLPPPDPPCPR